MHCIHCHWRDTVSASVRLGLIQINLQKFNAMRSHSNNRVISILLPNIFGKITVSWQSTRLTFDVFLVDPSRLEVFTEWCCFSWMFVTHLRTRKILKRLERIWLATGWLQSGLIGADQGRGPTEFLAGRNYISHYHIVYLEVDFSVTACDFEVHYVVEFYQVPTT